MGMWTFSELSVRHQFWISDWPSATRTHLLQKVKTISSIRKMGSTTATLWVHHCLPTWQTESDRCSIANRSPRSHQQSQKSQSLPADNRQHNTGTTDSKERIVIVIDRYSVLYKTHSEHIIRFRQRVFARHGFPDDIKTDNGSNLVSEEKKQFLEHCGIKHKRSTPYWPKGNATVERFNRTIHNVTRTAVSERKN